MERGAGIEIVVIDVTEHGVERPKRRQRRYYSVKKRKHTLKSQIVANQQTGKIIRKEIEMGGDMILTCTSKGIQISKVK